MKFTMLGGDFPKYSRIWRHLLDGHLYLGQMPLAGRIESVEIVTEENKKKLLGAAGWGFVGGILLGPIGALAGLLAGGRKAEICFACVLKDGRRFLAVSEPQLYRLLLAEQLKPQRPDKSACLTSTALRSHTTITSQCKNCGGTVTVNDRFCTVCGFQLSSQE